MPTNSDSPLLVFLPPRPWKVDLVNADTNSQVTQSFPNDTFNHLQNLGVKVKILIPSFSRFSFIKNINPFIAGLDLFRALKVLIFYRNASCIISIVESGGLFILLLRKFFFFKPKIILWDLSSGNNWRVVKTIQALCLPRYDGFMLLTSSQKDFIIRNNYQGKVRLINYNVDEEFFNPKYSEDGEYILSVGDDISRDYDTLLEALIKVSFPAIIKSSIINQIPSRSNIKIIKERLSNEMYRDLIGKAKIVVIPLKTMEHAGGITFLFESMAMGKPIIITEGNLAKDYLKSYDNCLFVPENDPNALAKATTLLLNNQELRLQLSLNVRKGIESFLTTKHLAEKIKDFCLEF